MSGMSASWRSMLPHERSLGAAMWSHVTRHCPLSALHLWKMWAGLHGPEGPLQYGQWWCFISVLYIIIYGGVGSIILTFKCWVIFSKYAQSLRDADSLRCVLDSSVNEVTTACGGWDRVGSGRLLRPQKTKGKSSFDKFKYFVSPKVMEKTWDHSLVEPKKRVSRRLLRGNRADKRAPPGKACYCLEWRRRGKKTSLCSGSWG